MFDYCKHHPTKDGICPFSVSGTGCGNNRAKGASLINDVESCDGKTPKYSKVFLDKLKAERDALKLKQKGLL